MTTRGTVRVVRRSIWVRLARIGEAAREKSIYAGHVGAARIIQGVSEMRGKEPRMPGKTMMLSIVSIASLAAAMFAATALAAPDARLGGDFKMNGKITSSRGGFGTQVGERVTRIYKFRPRCASGPCDVTFRRQSADGFRKSIARRVNPGVYKAVDRVRAPCTSGGRVVGRQPVTTKTKITITRGADGDATKIAAKLLVTAPKSGRCPSARQTASLTGSLR